MKKTTMSKDAILLKIGEIVARDGLNALSIRGLAKELGCSVGTIYYYFQSKDELITTAIESVWEDIFRVDESMIYSSFTDYMKDIVFHISTGIKKYPNFFTLHSIMLQTDGKQKAKSSMSRYMSRLKDRMLYVLAKDEKLRTDVFTDEYSKEDFTSFIMSNIMSFIIDPSYSKDFFIKSLERILY